MIAEVLTPYRVTFRRIGRNRNVAPMNYAAVNATDLAAAIHNYAEAFLGTRRFEAVVNLTTMEGHLDLPTSGIAGRFTVTVETEDNTPVED